MSSADTDIREPIVDTAVELAEESSWEAVRLHDIASRLDITLDDIRRHFREKEDIVDAWFDRADQAMLAVSKSPGFHDEPPRLRLQRLILTWLDALASHRRVTRQMIYNKLEPGHLHIQIPGLLRISRTVQWFREAALRDAIYLRRALEETGLTTIYLLTFFCWMHDDSPGSRRTRQFLERRLLQAERLDRLVYGFCGGCGHRQTGNADTTAHTPAR
ncbi:MAG: TetR/AcrR family transcriptional regulator [Gammaproteobacteria bacterium]|nr:TetR/AcrR family transcriptional regulator [Gammaproteobacteria bacterium]